MDDHILRKAARAGQAPLSRFFDPRFNMLLERISAFTGRFEQRDAEFAEVVSELRRRTEHTQVAAEDAAEWARELTTVVQRLLEDRAAAPASPASPAAPEPPLNVAVAAGLGALGPGSTVGILPVADRAAATRVLETLGVAAVPVADGDIPDRRLDGVLVGPSAAPGDLDRARGLVDPGAPLAALVPVTLAGALPAGWDVREVRVLLPAETPDGTWRAVRLARDELSRSQSEVGLLMVRAIAA